MGKNNEPAPPKPKKYANSVLKVGDETVAKTYTDKDGSIVSEVIPTASQKTINNFVDAELTTLLPKLNVLSDEYINSKNETLQAVKNQAKRAIGETYDPMFEDLKKDIASRFGSLANSSFLEELNSIEKQKTRAIAENEDGLILLSQQLDDNERLKNMDYLNTLLNLQASNDSGSQGYLSVSGYLSNALNNYNTSNYKNDVVYYNALNEYNRNKGILGKYTPAYLK